ncbi:MAG: peptide ABC transporter substrate-binding protein [Clostridia bacterium]|nr:peptide ABC transporter substrate-binding protein [Clostridia bacterium]
MKTLKSVLALMLALIMCAVSFTGCSTKDEDDKGAEINMYIANLPLDLDPTRIQFDSENLKFYSLLYESLFKINEDGKLENALVKESEWEEDERDGKIKLVLKLNKTSWSDGVSVTADDVVFTFKRILDPDNSNPAAALLYPIENAKAAKSGLMTIDDVGFSAINPTTVEIIFEEGFTDVEHFKRSLASPVFTPVREDIVMQYGEDWAQPIFAKYTRQKDDAFSSIVTNGPFTIKEWSEDSVLLERSIYFRNVDPEGDLAKQVTPYRIVVNYSDDADTQLANYSIGKKDENYLNRNFFIGSFTKEGYESVKSDVKTFDNNAMYTYYFNASNKALSDARVRRALSIALDRNEIASIVGRGVQPATGFVPTGVAADNKGKKDYRDQADAVIVTSAQLDEAKALLKEAKVNKGNITIAIRNDLDWEKEVADYVKGVWSSLGFTVNVKRFDAQSDSKNVISEYEKMIATGDFDVIAVNQCALSDDAYSFLAPFAREFSGSIVPVDDDAVPSTPHVTGFDNEEYNTLIGTFEHDPETGDILSMTGVLVAKNAKERLEIYKQAEKLLADNAPCAPLFFGTNSYLVSGELSKVKYNNVGAPVFTKTKLKDYNHYKLEVEEEEDEEAEEAQEAAE